MLPPLLAITPTEILNNEQGVVEQAKRASRYGWRDWPRICGTTARGGVCAKRFDGYRFRSRSASRRHNKRREILHTRCPDRDSWRASRTWKALRFHRLFTSVKSRRGYHLCSDAATKNKRAGHFLYS